ncbi:ATP-NAD kinase-like domain-containing protein [Coniella lustricola]|uniref:ATP-NAD kinase-like domain-containing protein n=1 Tax=Coniella lustricola TaxID=2025994 RepID=A0A2T3A4E5_9PEZI|nr:ATP-NAD kinase-like domain-containing protein [Coniella lustricola]
MLREIREVSNLPDRVTPLYQDTAAGLLSLHWSSAPRNILLIPKLHAPKVVEDAVRFARHLHNNYPDINIVFESRIADRIHHELPFPIYSTARTDPATQFPNKIDLVTTLGGDGTILRAASLFSLQPSVPPILSFSMGTLGFLGEWKFGEFKDAWTRVYTSGNVPPASRPRVLLRHRLKVGVFDEDGKNINSQLMPTSTAEAHQRLRLLPMTPEQEAAIDIPNWVPPVKIPPTFHAVNELLLHRGGQPHLAIIDVFVNNHFLTEAICDGILVSTPTGSTAYSLSAGGAIVHPLVGSLLITPICPRSLSFRPLVLPLDTKVVLRLSDRNRGRELEVSIDGKRRTGASPGMEIRVQGESITKSPDGNWLGGVPCVIRDHHSSGEAADGVDDDGWVGGLNGLLKFNYPFGNENA